MSELDEAAKKYALGRQQHPGSASFKEDVAAFIAGAIYARRLIYNFSPCEVTQEKIEECDGLKVEEP